MRKTFITAGLLLLAAGLLAAMPFLPAVVSSGDYYGHRTEVTVPALSRAPVPAEGINVVFFGYNHCGTVCPLQLLNLRQLHDATAGEPVQFVFVTLDPERDSQAELDRVMAGLGQRFVAVRPENLREALALALSYGDMAARTGNSTGYDFNHSGHLHVVTPSGHKQLVYTSPELDLDRVHEDLRRLMAQQRRESDPV